jgi:hypothetical protein
LVRYFGAYEAAVEDALLTIALDIIVTLMATVVGAVLAFKWQLGQYLQLAAAKD